LLSSTIRLAIHHFGIPGEREVARLALEALIGADIRFWPETGNIL
jgi:hypothetical protein